MNTVNITGPKELVAILANGINDELNKPTPDAEKVASMRSGLDAALSLCTVTVRNSSSAGDRWS